MIDLQVFEAMAGNSLVLLPDIPVFTVVAATEDYLNTLGRLKTELTNKGIFDAFSPAQENINLNDIHQLRFSLEKVINSKALDQMPIVRFDIKNQDGTFEERYWTAINKPVIDKNGQVVYIIHTAQELTSKGKNEQSPSRLKSLEKSYDLFMQVPVTIGVVKGPEYVIELANDNLLEIWGRTSDVIGKSLFNAIPELKEQGFKELLDQVLKSGEPYYAYEYPILITRKGKNEVFYFDFVYKPYFEDDEITPVGVLAVGHNVTKQVESRHKFKTVIEESNDPILILKGKDLIIDTANQALFDLWQVGPEAVGKTFLEVLPEMEGQGFNELLLKVYQWGEPFYGNEVPAIFTRKNGIRETIYFDFSYQPYRNVEGNIEGVLVMARNVTQNVLSRKKIEESEAYFRQLTDTLPAIIWITRSDGYCTYLNENWYKYTGQTPGEAEGFGWLKAIHPEDAKEAGRLFLEAVKEHQPYFITYRLRHKSGEYRWAIDSGLPKLGSDGRFEGMIGTVIDIHEQKLSEDKIRESERRYRSIFQTAGVSIWEEDFSGVKKAIEDLKEKGINDFSTYFTQHPEFVEDCLNMVNVIDVNDSTLVLFEADNKNQLLGNLHKIFLPETMPVFVGELLAVAEEKTNYESECRLRTLKGKHIDILFRMKLPFPGESFDSVLFTLLDITERKANEKNIRISQERFRFLAEAFPHLAWTTSKDGKATFFNRRWYEYTGLSEEFAIKDDGRTVLHPSDWQKSIINWEKHLQRGEPFETELRYREGKSGKYRWFLVKAVPVKNEEGQVLMWIGTGTDIHEQKLAMESLETLIVERTKELHRSNNDLQQFAHVASHDLKEPVRKIKTFVNRLESHLETGLDEKSKRYIEKIHSAANRIYTMIEGVLSYSTINSYSQPTELVDLNEVINNIETDLEVIIQQTGSQVAYVDLPIVEGYSVLLYQLFYNLINNSIKFAKDNSPALINIYSKYIQEDERQLIKIVLSDNGIGFEEEQAAAIFDTFTRLNSKDKYEGTGLGLALCKKIVERHGGRISAEGNLNIGATFTIILPENQNSRSQLTENNI